jgi:acetyl esterase/lipase/lysophospholipase L1-like esterase
MRSSISKATIFAALLIGNSPAFAESPAASAIPFSSLASPEARRAWDNRNAVRLPPDLSAQVDKLNADLGPKFDKLDSMTEAERYNFFVELRAHDDLIQVPNLTAQKEAYKVTITPKVIAGVETEIFTPEAGILPSNEDRVLINLHGGAFIGGAGIASEIESIPVSAVGRIKVISVNYRLAPEHHFPAAVEDVLAVYRDLLKIYKPGNIGIFGFSSGGTLTAEATAAIIAQGLPRPGAIGMFSGTGEVWAKGDSAYFFGLLNGSPPNSVEQNFYKFLTPYLQGADTNDPLVFPMRNQQYLAAFPPSLLISGTRAQDMSTIADANNKLAAAGVETSLHIWDGVQHGFFYDPTLPESRQAYDAIARFFAVKLGPWYRPELQNFLAEDLASPAAKCSILFVGSSSIRFWKNLQEDMAPAKVLNRGFGGSTISDINDVFDEVVTPYWPKAIFFYAGENDISADHRSPAKVVTAFEQFMAMKTTRLGNVPVYFISIKPSKLRWADLRLQQETNHRIQRLASTRSDLHFVDVAAGMLDKGSVRDIFGPDNLHMTPEGYNIWTAKLRPLVLREASQPAPRCRTQVSRNFVR